MLKTPRELMKGWEFSGKVSGRFFTKKSVMPMDDSEHVFFFLGWERHVKKMYIPTINNRHFQVWKP